MKTFLNALALKLAIWASTGSGGKIRYPAYYRLKLPPAPGPPAQESIRTSIAVREFQSLGYLRQGRLCSEIGTGKSTT